jgi:hypothetical protein
MASTFTPTAQSLLLEFQPLASLNNWSLPKTAQRMDEAAKARGLDCLFRSSRNEETGEVKIRLVRTGILTVIGGGKQKRKRKASPSSRRGSKSGK